MTNLMRSITNEEDVRVVEDSHGRYLQIGWYYASTLLLPWLEEGCNPLTHASSITTLRDKISFLKDYLYLMWYRDIIDPYEDGSLNEFLEDLEGHVDFEDPGEVEALRVTKSILVCSSFNDKNWNMPPTSRVCAFLEEIAYGECYSILRAGWGKENLDWCVQF